MDGPSTVLYGIPVHTMDGKTAGADEAACDSAVICGGRILFAGPAEEAFKRYPNGERVKLEGGCLLPGFIDAHLHLREFSLLYCDLDLTAAETREEILAAVEKAAGKKKNDDFIVGGGADFGLLRTVGREELDGVTGAHPLVVHSRDLHSVLVNSAALSAGSIDEGRSDPMGGAIERDAKGVPTGILRERAVDIIRRVIPERKSSQVRDAVEHGMERLLQNGITCFCDCSVFEEETLLSILSRLTGGSGAKNMNIRAVCMFSDRDATRLGNLGFRSGFGDEFIRVGGCKIIIDGSLGSGTGYMRKPYRGGESRGLLLTNEDELYEILKRSYTHYIHAAVHAVGDAANEIALNVMERLNRERGVPKLVKRIEHAQSLEDEDIARFAPNNVAEVVNPSHISLDRDRAVKYLGSDARLLYRLRSLAESGAVLAFASDAPAGSINPLYGIYLAVERKGYSDGPELRFLPRERISTEQAVYAATMGGAKALGMEEEVGSIEPGKRADLVHLSEDIFSIETDRLRDVAVLKTFVGGNPVYERP